VDLPYPYLLRFPDKRERGLEKKGKRRKVKRIRAVLPLRTSAVFGAV